MSGGIYITNAPVVLGGGMLKTALPLNATSQFVQDNAGNTSALSLSTSLVGIGTTTPLSQLEIKGNTDGTLRISGSSSTSSTRRAVFTYNNAPDIFEIDVSNALRIKNGSNYSIYANSSGNVGLGTFSPTAKLQVAGAGATSATTSFLVENSASNSALTIKDDRSTFFGGLVGINNATPATNLDVAGNIFFSANNFIGSGNSFAVLNKVGLYNGATGDIDITMWNGGWYIRHNANMSMAGSLNVGDNTTGTARLQVKGSGATAATNAVTVKNSSGTQILNIRDDGFTTIGQSNQGLTTYGVIGTGYVETGSTGQFTSTSRFVIKPDASTGADGNILLSNTAGSSFGILKLGGTTSSFPAIKRNLAVIDFKLADDSGYCDTQSGNLNYQFLLINGNYGYNRLQDGLYVTADFSVAKNASSIVEFKSTTKGFLPPRMTTTEKNAIVTPAAGLIVYDSTLNKLCVRTAAAWETIQSI